MPIDPRTLGTSPASPGDTPVLSPSIVAGIIQATSDLDRRVSTLEASRTVIGPQTISGGSTGMLQVGSITAANITAGNVVASIMTANTVNAGHINAASIFAAVISATLITTNSLQTNMLNAVQAAVGTLSAITANMGSITAGTITGGTVQTSASGARVVLDSAGLRGYALDGTTKVFEINAGTGVASFTGIATIDPASVVPAGTLTGFVGGGNLLQDSSFESTDPALPASKWANGGAGGVFSKQTTVAFHGTTSLRVLYGAPSGYCYTNLRTAHGVPIAAMAGRPLVASAWVYVTGTDNTTPTTDKAIQFSTNVATIAGGPAISTIPKNTWTRVVHKTTIPSGVTDVYMLLMNPWSSGLNTVYFDGVQVEVGDAPTGYAPKPDEILYASISTTALQAGAVTANTIAAGSIQATHIGFTYGGQNRFSNSSFEAPLGVNTPTLTPFNMSTPTRVNATTSASVIPNGTWIVKATSTSATGTIQMYSDTDQVAVVVGRKYTYSAWVYHEAGAPRTMSIGYRAFSAVGGSFVGQNWGGFVVATNTWTRISYTYTVGAGVGATGWVLSIDGQAATGEAYYLDAIQMEEGEIATSYAPRGDEILPGSVGNTQITPNSITADRIIAVSLAAIQANVTTLGAITANLGTITAGTITGATFQTAASGARVTMNASGVTAVDASANTTFAINSSGAVSLTGAVYAKTGLSMDAATSSTPPSANRLRWLDATLTSVGEVYAYTSGGTAVTALLARAAGRSDSASITMSHGTAGQVSIGVQDGGGTPNARVVLKSTGQSCFVHAASNDGSASQNMWITTQGSVSVTVPHSGQVSAGFTAPSSGLWTMVGYLTGAFAHLCSWGVIATNLLGFYNYHATIDAPITFYYQFIRY